MNESLRKEKITRLLRVFLVGFVAIFLLAAYRVGIFEKLSSAEELKQTIVSLGGWGYAAFVLSYAFFQPFGLPGALFIWSAPFIWPWYIAYILSLIGTQAASIVGFSFARFMGRDWLADKIPERFQRYNESLEKRAFLTVFMIRFFFWMHPLLHTFFGLSKVSFGAHFWGSLLGYAIPFLFVSWFGPKIVDLVFQLPWWAFVLLVVTFGVLAFFWYRKKG